jgi:hypothetical protein
MLCLVKEVKDPFFTMVPGFWDTPFNRGLDDNPYSLETKRRGD